MKEFLSQRHVPFVERDVAVDHSAAMEMVQRTGQRRVPVTVIGDEVVIGFDRRRLEHALEQSSAIAPVRLGATVADAARVGVQLESAPTTGAYVGQVKPGSLAARIGLSTGDIIVELGGRAVRTAQDVEAALGMLRRGQPAMLVYERDKRRESLRFTP